MITSDGPQPEDLLSDALRDQGWRVAYAVVKRAMTAPAAIEVALECEDGRAVRMIGVDLPDAMRKAEAYISENRPNDRH